MTDIQAAIGLAQLQKLPKFLESRKNIASKYDELFNKSDLFVLLSEDFKLTFEGYGLVYLEALSYGLPTIVSSQSGCSEIIFKDSSGIVVNPRDYKKISKFIYSITKKDISKISNRCIEIASKKDWKYKRKEIEKLYK